MIATFSCGSTISLLFACLTPVIAAAAVGFGADLPEQRHPVEEWRLVLIFDRLSSAETRLATRKKNWRLDGEKTRPSAQLAR
jgi:hypothetical protein